MREARASVAIVVGEAAVRAAREGEDRCSNDQPVAAMPPRGSPEHWAHGGRWKANNESLRSRHTSFRRFGRCNNELNVCLHLDAQGTATRQLSDCERIARNGTQIGSSSNAVL